MEKDGFRVSQHDEGAFHVAFVVIRPHLLDEASARWPDVSMLQLTSDTQILEIVPKGQIFRGKDSPTSRVTHFAESF